MDAKTNAANDGDAVGTKKKIDGAEEKSRTPTGKPPLDPEPSASTSSATSARSVQLCSGPPFVKTFLTDSQELRRRFDLGL